MSNITSNAGRVAMVYRNAWSSTSAYSMLDVVTWNGETYCACSNITAPESSNNQNPESDTAHWFKLANRGSDFKIDGVADSSLPEASQSLAGKIYFKKTDSKLYFCQADSSGQTTSYSWIEMCQFQTQGNKLSCGNTAPSSTEGANAGDLYLNYATSVLYQCTLSDNNLTWTAKGTLSGISNIISGEGTITSVSWTGDSAPYSYTTDVINGLAYNDQPIIGLSEGPSDQWNYIYKVETINLSNGCGLKFYSTVKPSSSLTFKYNLYNFEHKDIYKAWSNPNASIFYTDSTTPSVTAQVNNDDVSFNFSLPKEKFTVEASASSPNEPTASMTQQSDGTWKLSLGIPKSSGEGVAGRAATLTLGTVTTLPSGSNPQIEMTGTESDRILNFGLPVSDTNVSAGSGINITTSGSTKTISHSNITTQKTDSDFYKIKIDTNGHIIEALNTDKPIIAPANPGSGQSLIYNGTAWAASNILPTSAVENQVLTYKINSGVGSWQAGTLGVNKITTQSGDKTGDITLIDPNEILWKNTQQAPVSKYDAIVYDVINDVGQWIHTPIQKSYTAIIPTSGWAVDPERGGYSQTVTVTGISSDTTLIIMPVDNNYAWVENGVKAVSQNTNSITFNANTQPTMAIDIKIVEFFCIQSQSISEISSELSNWPSEV